MKVKRQIVSAAALFIFFSMGLTFSSAYAQGYGEIRPATAGEESKNGLEGFKTNAVFELAVHKSSVLKIGDGRLVTESAFATLTNKFFGGRINALLIQFFTRPITAEGQNDLLQNDGKEMTSNDHVALVLFLDQQKQISQINLTYVVPGTSVVRTVAYTPDQIRKYVSDYRFDRERLRLKSKGSYNEPASGDEQVDLSWEMDLDVPVFDATKK